MNKTVNINLANILFHIDEGAYHKMRLYLEAIKRSFANTPGSDEIITDIEARIAELFQEKLLNERQVITEKEVDEVITIMGQPEDYMVDEDIFEDEPKARTSEPKKNKKLYRDREERYVAGVSSGIGHYLGIDPLWIRLLWVFLTVAGIGSFVLLYGLLWILIPEARTTSQKLDMRGEDINISNIERKVKEGFDDVAEKVKNVDYNEVGNKVKQGGKTIFDTLGDIIMFFFKVFGKFIGIILIITGASVVIGLSIALLTVGVAGAVHIPGIDFYNIVNSTNTPVWVVSLLVFFAVGIPFFFLLYLGLKILVTNLKSIGNIAKFSLLGLWLIAIITLFVLGIKQAAAYAYSGNITTEDTRYFKNVSDTLYIKAVETDLYENREDFNMNGMTLSYTNEGDEVLLSNNVRYHIKKSKDSLVHIELRKGADGSSREEARESASRIDYNYEIEGNTIFLDNFLTTASENHFKDQEVRVNIYLPVGTLIKYERGNSRCRVLRVNTDYNIGRCDFETYSWKMSDNGNKLICLDCPEEEIDEDEEGKIKINKNGININIQDDNGESFKMKINEDGINIKAKENDEDNQIIINEDGIDIDVKDGNDELNMQIGESGIQLNN